MIEKLMPAGHDGDNMPGEDLLARHRGKALKRC
jgi:hypothetical protein